MDSCLGVEQDLDKATSKFTVLNDHTNKILEEVINQVEELRREISQQPPNTPLTQNQAKIVNDLVSSVKQSVFQLSTDHRELHATVSRVGKSIDRHFIADYAAVAPKAESFCSDTNRPIMEQAIAQHLYRQDLEDVGDSLVGEARVGVSERGSTFAQLQRCAAALAAAEPAPALAWAAAREHDLTHSPLLFTLHRMQMMKDLEDVGDSLVGEARVGVSERGSTFAQLQRCAAALAAAEPAPALAWAAAREHDLTHSPLLFTLHRMQMMKLARSEGVSAAIAYARAHLAPHVARHERALRACMGVLVWCAPGAPPAPPPPDYAHLLDLKALGAEAGELFLREACSLLRLAPHSPLAGAVLAGARVLPALHDIRAKMSHPHVLAAWADDELPLEVELGSEGGGYHSVFACPILRQQASDHNPPMRLLCGHVISRDALNKLAMGLKLKCPYCPMEQSPSEARQIYFS